MTVRSPRNAPRNLLEYDSQTSEGGGDLAATLVLDDEPSTSLASQPSFATQTRSVGQTCQPRVHQTSCQTISCIRCGELGHSAQLCVTTDTSKPPSALYCKNCTMSYSYTDDTTITVNLTTCLAHQRSPQKSKKHKAASKVLQKVEKMLKEYLSTMSCHLWAYPRRSLTKLRLLFVVKFDHILMFD